MGHPAPPGPQWPGLIEYYLDLTERLRERITAEPRLQLLAGGPWPVACFRIADPHESDSAALHTRVARRVQDNGRAFLTTVDVRGRTVLRACLCNYRTTTDDLDLLIREVLHAADAEQPADERAQPKKSPREVEPPWTSAPL